MHNTKRINSKLREIVGESNLVIDLDQLKMNSIDGKRPKAIVLPSSIDEVSRLVSYASDNHFAIIPKGNGTKIEIGGIPKKVDIILSTSRLNRIMELDTDNLTLSFECGVTLGEIQKRLTESGRGYFIPLDPPFKERATMGGIVATNSSGAKRYLYGTVRDWLIGTKVVFPNGDIVSSGGKTVKNVSGYDLHKLLIGSFGSLGIICEMTFKILPLPDSQASLLFFFKNLDDVDQFSYEITHSCYLPSSIEILNITALKNIQYSMPIPEGGNYLLSIGLEGISESVDRQLREMVDIGKKNGAVQITTLTNNDYRCLWSEKEDFYVDLRKNLSDFFLLKSNLLPVKSIKIIGIYEEVSKEFGMSCSLICHPGSGIIYAFGYFDRNARKKREALFEMIRRFTFETLKYEGNLVVQYSPLSVKRKVNIWGELRNDFMIMNRLKKEIDPNGVFSPGRFVGGI